MDGDSMRIKTYTFEGNNYELIKNYKEGFEKDVVESLITDYFKEYDYIVGDWSYGHLRLKGFCNKNNKLFKKINDINRLDIYIKNNCAYDCRYFVLKRV